MIEIRKVEKEEVGLLQKLAIQTFMETYSSHNSEENMKNYIAESFSMEKLAEELGNKTSQYHFAIENGSTIGYLKTEIGKSNSKIADEKSLKIARIYVLKEYQGKKIGHLLFQKAVEIAKEENLNFVCLGVWEKNQKAIDFYKRNGFKETDQITFKLGDDVQKDILMTLKLD